VRFDPCRCGSVPVDGDGRVGGSFVVVVACRAPERHSPGEPYIAVGLGETLEESRKLAREKWESVNPRPGRGN
jgi:hypothetical protein